MWLTAGADDEAEVLGVIGDVEAAPGGKTLDKKFPIFGHDVRVIFGEPVDPDDFGSVQELLDEVQTRIAALDVPA